jgi:hypothetical protein
MKHTSIAAAVCLTAALAPRAAMAGKDLDAAAGSGKALGQGGLQYAPPIR